MHAQKFSLRGFWGQGGRGCLPLRMWPHLHPIPFSYMLTSPTLDMLMPISISIFSTFNTTFTSIKPPDCIQAELNKRNTVASRPI